jgi:hypothetical protein
VHAHVIVWQRYVCKETSAFNLLIGTVLLQLATLRLIVKREGPRALWHGLSARVAFHIPSAAVCWGVYESVKSFANIR